MSSGLVCRCVERDVSLEKRRWVVTARRCNYSAFNGYRCTSSDYSEVWCLVCNQHWRTKAEYVEKLRDARKGEVEHALYGGAT